MKAKEIIIWLSIFIVGSIIVSAIINPSIFNNLKNRISNIESPFSTSGLDIISNPEQYIDKEVTIKDAFIGGYKRSHLGIEEEDGNWVYLKYNYYRKIRCVFADLTGTFRIIDGRENGLIQIDSAGNEIDKEEYYFDVTKAVCKD